MTVDKDLNGYILRVGILFKGDDKAHYVGEARYFFKNLPSFIENAQLRPQLFSVIKYYNEYIPKFKPISIGAVQDYLIEKAEPDLIDRVNSVLHDAKLSWKSSYFVELGEIMVVESENWEGAGK